MRALLAVFAWLSIGASAAPLFGCGYRLLHADPQTTISIVTLANDSVEPGIEMVVTRALRQEFLRRGAPRLVSDPAGADVVIQGRVLPVSTRVTSFDSVALAAEYQVELQLELEVVHEGGRTAALDASELRESELYLASADLEATRKNREEALRRIADVLAGRIHDALDLELAGIAS